MYNLFSRRFVIFHIRKLEEIILLEINFKTRTHLRSQNLIRQKKPLIVSIFLTKYTMFHGSIIEIGMYVLDIQYEILGNNILIRQLEVERSLCHLLALSEFPIFSHRFLVEF